MTAGALAIRALVDVGTFLVVALAVTGVRAALRLRGPVNVLAGQVFPHPTDDRWEFGRKYGGEYYCIGDIEVWSASVMVDQVQFGGELRARRFYRAIQKHRASLANEAARAKADRLLTAATPTKESE